MSPLRVVVLLAGAGSLLVGGSAGAALRPGSPSPEGAAAGEVRALGLLTAAARAARSLTYSGTQYVSTWRADTASSQVADIRHTGGGSSVVSVQATAGNAGSDSVALASELDMRLLHLLAEHYELGVAPDGTCTGRSAHVVEARRRSASGTGVVAGRFWLDAQTSLVLRREVFDRGGRLVRSSAFAALTVEAAVPDLHVLHDDVVSQRLDVQVLDRMRREGWQVPMSLPGDMELFDVRVRSHDGKDVMHLSYSDGLSTLSLFAQRGRLGTEPVEGFAKRSVGHSNVWVRSTTSPQRVVWGGGGRVFTLVTDAPPESLSAAVKALPHDAAPKTGILARVARGLARLASWLNPFD
jgi:sigma-E factor negative regulatory protein RseB